MLFLIPLTVAVVGALYLWFQEAGLTWKLIVSAIVLASLLLQLVPALEVHFVIPLSMQVLVGVGLLIYWKFTGYT